MNKSLIVIFASVSLDAMGIGLIFPILPNLLKELTEPEHTALYIGIMAALYAMMQLVFSPMLGALSDRYGRRPVLLLSLLGSAINYLCLAFSSCFTLLLLGRAIAGITSATISVASAYLTDTSPKAIRAKRFGLLNAMFGCGFIIGPVLGGLLGDYWLRLPFIAAAILTGANFLLAWYVLPESHTSKDKKLDLSLFNPLQPLRWMLSGSGLIPLVLTFFMFSATGEAYGICWVLWGQDTFQWNGLWVGVSLGFFGVFQMLVQVFLTGPAASYFGERRAVFVGISSACVALIGMAFAQQTWVVLIIMPIFALGSVGTPALQALATQQVSAEHQGRLQGVLASSVSLASVIAPLLFSSVYFAVQSSWPGAIWLSVVVIYICAIPCVMMATRSKYQLIEV